MTYEEVNAAYFNWMCQLIGDFDGRSYNHLLEYLHKTDFVVLIMMDENRADDGVDLRYRFGYEADIEDSIIASYLDDRPCSVLEMMIALAMRCEEHIMDDPDVGDRTGQWFWGMIENLNLDDFDDSHFAGHKSMIDFFIKRLLEREYEPNGEGGLFTVHDCSEDLRAVEIWYQMCWYLDEIV